MPFFQSDGSNFPEAGSCSYQGEVTGPRLSCYFSEHADLPQEAIGGGGLTGNVVLILRNPKMLQVAPLLCFMRSLLNTIVFTQ